MKFILYLTKRIIIFFIALTIPTTIAFASFNIIKMGIQPYNVGIRSIFNLIIDHFPIIIFTSYTLAIIFSIILIDKTKINNLVSLHLSPIVITIIILSLFFLLEGRKNNEKFFIDSKRNIQIGKNTFFKQEVFNDFDRDIIYFNYENNRSVSFVYDKSKNTLLPLKNISYNDDILTLYPRYKHTSPSVIRINYSMISKKSTFFSNKLVKTYTSKLEILTKNLKKIYYGLDQQDKIIFLSSFVLSFIIFIVPLSFLINDGGWSISGLIGVVLILAILPLLYNLTFNFEFKYKNILSFLGRFNYLICPIGFFILGFLLDIFIKLFHKAEV